MMRLDKYLSERLGIPRGESRKLAAKGRVTVNGVLTKKADTQIEEATAEVAMDGRLLAGAYQKYVYLMLNKPEGVVSAAQDKRDTTVVDLVKDAFPRRQLFPAGRLDKTSTGFVLLTDDGTLAHDILAPGRHVPKQYLVTLDTPLTNAMRVGFAAGVTLADEPKKRLSWSNGSSTTAFRSGASTKVNSESTRMSTVSPTTSASGRQTVRVRKPPCVPRLPSGRWYRKAASVAVPPLTAMTWYPAAHTTSASMRSSNWRSILMRQRSCA